MKSLSKSFLHALTWICACIVIFVIFASIYYWHSKSQPAPQAALTWWEYLKQFPFDHAFLFGVFSSFAGVVLTFYLVRPSFTINPVLAWDNNNRIRLMVSNRNWFTDLTNVSIEMYFIRYVDKFQDKKYLVIPFTESGRTVIHGRCAGEEECNYITHTQSGFIWDEKYSQIQCRIIATHAITGVTRIKEQIYTKDNIKRGVFQHGQFVPYKELYPADCCKFWDQEMKNRCHKIWDLSDKVLAVIRPIQDVEEITSADYQTAIDELRNFRNQEYIDLFPCLLNNQSTIYDMIEMINTLKEKRYTNFNPSNKKERKELVDELNKYLVFLTLKMDDDIWQYYKNDTKG